MKSVIELVKTTQGYSIVEDGQEINKITNRGIKQKQFSAAPKKFVQQNFTIYPYLYCRQPEYAQKYIIIPAKSQWFNMNQIHENQKKALPQWFKTKKAVFGAAKPDKFQKNEELYKKYRNYIIDLARYQYLSPTAARKGLAGDVCAILRIHSFLQQNGIINYVFPKKSAKNQTNKSQSNKRAQHLSSRKDCIDKQKTIFEKHFDKDHLQLLKKNTKKIRPICHLCQGICGVLWFQYQKQLYIKRFQIQSQIKNKNVMKQDYEQRKQTQKKETISKGKIYSDDKPIKYLLRLCSHCFNTGNLPVVLSHDDFKRYSILDEFNYQYEQPKDKKKIAQQNKLIQNLQKNKFSLKKTAQSLKISEKQVVSLLLNLPIIKIQKLARIDQQTQIQDDQNVQPKINGILPPKQQEIKLKESQLKKIVDVEQKLVNEFCNEYKCLEQQEEKLYEQFIQLWLLKVSTKLGKLSEWEKSTTWFASRLINDQKNNLAEALKQI